MSNFILTIKTFLKELNNILIIIQDYIIIKVIKFLGSKFETYIIVLNKKTYNKKYY